jgi:hypothetical protein
MTSLQIFLLGILEAHNILAEHGSLVHYGLVRFLGLIGLSLRPSTLSLVKLDNLLAGPCRPCFL